ncbi:arginyl-tRNA synthetase [Hathewaya proteolytica DSM 3090]|uniref:Arginine--tRNA ligase n=1 Tax=Hathewaya proteolytica DSM 3090 TaxID=1121331 RepID=A0A1M6LIM4_9CLOT|nr:arginine--tRNA ligase [Hathewaya proteolytica]SHJ71022.1 arginyl-tRNA synthetase [Hathewaya proteolytica DSM 3090]
MDYKKIIAENIGKLVDTESDKIEALIEIPPQSDMGDFAFPCFQFAKVLRKSPQIIAGELKDKLDMKEFDTIEAVGPYLNFFVNKGVFSSDLVQKVLEEKEDYGKNQLGAGKNIIVEFSSPNIAKPFHIGHLFSTAIGNSLYRILSAQGYNCTRINHLGDWGTQFGKLISAYERWIDLEALEKDPISELLRIYVKFHEETENEPALEDEARLHFKNLEDGAEYETKLWKKFRELSLVEFEKVYKMLGVEFDSYNGESFYGDKMPAMVEHLEKAGILADSNGAKVVMLDEYNMPPCIIKKSDGATIYATRDLTAAKYRKDTYDFYKNIYVVGKEQKLHFRQIFKTLELAGFDWAQGCVHVPFGMVGFANEKLSTRKGKVVLLEQLLQESVDKVSKIIEEKNPDLENKDEVSKVVGIGAMVFIYLKNGREKDITFDWEEILSFDGETGPYVQYTYARAKSILRKLVDVCGEPNYGELTMKEEFELCKILSNFENNIAIAADRLEPSVISRYVLDVAKAFNKFYNNINISNTEDLGLKMARIKLVESTAIVIKNALSLLGIGVVEKM